MLSELGDQTVKETSSEFQSHLEHSLQAVHHLPSFQQGTSHLYLGPGRQTRLT